jgi:protein tyrosine phosphatase
LFITVNVSRLPPNADTNRYRNVLACDQTRVKLTGLTVLPVRFGAL